MKKLLLLILLGACAMARADNVFVTNDGTHPVPVTGSDITVNTTIDLTHLYAVPGATPSPSPARALVVQGIAGATAIAVSTPTPTLPSATLVSSSAYEASHVLKNAAGTLISLIGYNSKGSAQFIQLYDSATVPANDAVPVVTFTVPAASNFSLDVPITGMPFSTGIAVANSSTGPTKTLGSTDVFFTAVVK